jgi:adenylate cyclase
MVFGSRLLKRWDQQIRSSMDVFEAYIPIDRRQAMARGESLPDRTRGTALFADISGFTPLTEALARSLGPRRGAEELTIHLNTVYQALIQEVDRYRGSVIAFAGDAITCWFEEDNGWRATTCAMAIQGAMAQFAQLKMANGEVVALAVKVGIAEGPARRFLVGRPDIQILDVLAGQTLGRMAAATHVASRGDVILDHQLAKDLGDSLHVISWKTDTDTGEQFAAVAGCRGSAVFSPWSSLRALNEETARPWLIRPVYERLRTGHGEFLTELRPGVAIFLKFSGIDYDEDADSGTKLSDYVSWVQEVLGEYEGYLIDVAIGDKGSYLYSCFGAPVAHENDTWRALTAAGRLVNPPPELGFVSTTQIGISAGTMRTGAYGGWSRRTYGVLGDHVNLAARLMEQAAPGQVLASEPVQRAAREMFEWEPKGSLKLKGKSGQIAVFRLTGPKTGSGSSLAEPNYALPMVGRQAELKLIGGMLSESRAGSGGMIRISAEAGMGKSRLVAEGLVLARQSGFRICAGQCQSFGMNTSYLVWWNICRQLFELDSALSPADQTQVLEAHLSKIDSSLLPRLPLLGALLNLTIPDNEITEHLDAKLRKGLLEALLIDCVRAAAERQPLLLILEDCHWIDPLSVDLLEVLARNAPKLQLLLLVTQRPPETAQLAKDSFDQLSRFTEMPLAYFTHAESEQLLQLKIEHLFGHRVLPPAELANRLIQRAEGNPFYLDEVLNFVHDQGINLQDPQSWEKIELPTSLHSLILSRIDRLSESQKTTLKLASVIGRLFPATAVWGVSNAADRTLVATDLEALAERDLIALDRPEPELVYLFKHVVTQEVTYESLPHATRSRLHTEIGLFLEELYSDSLQQNLDILAFHFDRSTNLGKKTHYLQKAGEAAQAHYANAVAISYYDRVLPLLGDPELLQVLLKLGKVHELIGDWKRAGACYQQAFEAAQRQGDQRGQASCQAATGDLLRKQGLFAEATDWLAIARTAFEDIGDQAGVGQTLHTAGTVAAMQGNYDEAQRCYHQSLAIRKKLSDQQQTASLLSNLGIIARFQGDYPTARLLMEQSLEIRRNLGDRWAIANSLNNLGVVLRDLGDYPLARSMLEESLGLNRQVGDRWAIANTLSSLGEVCIDQQDWAAVRGFLEESVRINSDLGDRTAVAFIIECFAVMAAAQGKADVALRLAAAAAAQRTTLGSPLSPAEQSRLDYSLASAKQALSEADQNRLAEEGAQRPWEQVVASVLEP